MFLFKSLKSYKKWDVLMEVAAFAAINLYLAPRAFWSTLERVPQFV